MKPTFAVVWVGPLVAGALLWVAPALGKSLDELQRLAVEETLPEVRAAAGLALAELWAAGSLDDDALRAWAREGASAELREAAGHALGTRLAARAPDRNALLALVVGDEPHGARVAAGEALTAALLAPPALELAELETLASEATDPLLREAVTPALAQAFETSPLEPRALLARAAGGPLAVQTAAAQAALGKLATRTLFVLDDSALLAVAAGQSLALPGALSGDSAQLRQAAADRAAALLGAQGIALDALAAWVGDPDASPEPRAALGPLLAAAWLGANLALDELEALAQGPTPELQAAAVDALVQAYVAAVGRLQLDRAALAHSVAEAPNATLALARARAVFVLVRGALLGAAGQAQVEAVVNGGQVELGGVTLDGAAAGFRQAAGEFLTGVYTFFGFIDRFANPLADLSALAGDDTLSAEWRQAAGEALAVVYRADRRRALDALDALDAQLNEILSSLEPVDVSAALEAVRRFRVRLAAELDGLVLSAEVAGDFTLRQTLTGELNRALTLVEQALPQGRLLTARAELANVARALAKARTSVSGAPEVTLATLLSVAASGATFELRAAAAQGLEARLPAAGLGFEALFELAASGAPAAQEAAVPALATAWQADAGTLFGFARAGATPAVRAAAARALLGSVELAHLDTAAWLEVAQGGHVALRPLTLDGALSAVQDAAGTALVPYFADPGRFEIEALILQAANAQTPALQRAAAAALLLRWQAALPDEPELFRLIGQHTLLFGARPGASAPLSAALSRALGQRFAAGALAIDAGEVSTLKG